MTVSPLLPTPVPGDAARIRMQGSATRLSLPVAAECNHLLGCILGGLRFAHWCDDSEHSGTYRYKASRHPNCDYLLVMARVSDWAQTDGTIEVTAGTGTAQSVTVYETSDAQDIYIVAPWHADDTTHEDVTVEVSDLGIESIACWDLQKSEFQSGDDFIAERDATHTDIGVHANRYIAQSATAGIDGMIDMIVNAEDHCKRQLTGWATLDEVTVTDSDWTNPWDDFVWRHNANAQESSTTTRKYGVWVRGKTTSADWRFRIAVAKSGTTLTYTSDVLTNTSYAWEYIDDVSVFVADSTLELEVQGVPVEGSTPTVSIDAVSIFRID